MAYDPDLDPIFEGFNSQLAGIMARLDKLDGGNVLTPELPQPSVVIDPVWKTLDRSKITIPRQIQVPAGQREIYVPISVDHTARESFYCYINRLVNVSGGGINVGNAADQAKNFEGLNEVYRWSPGDDLTHYVKVVTRSTYGPGKSFRLEIRVKGLGDSQKGDFVDVIFASDAQHPEMPEQFHRPLRKLVLENAQRKNRFDPSAVAFSDSGFDSDGRPAWRSRLSHGYVQDGNQETGLYMSEEKFPGFAQSPITHDATENALRLHTLAFPESARAEFDSRLFRHQAAIIQGQTMDEVCGAEGVWRMEAKIPIRRYSWPAFWLVGRGASGARGSWTQWPPEIDILEKFNQSWGSADTPYTTTFAQHYGDAGSNTRVGSFGNEIEVNQWLPGATALNEGYHSWACAVVYDANDPLKSEVTFFFDDVEVGCHVLHARHQDMKTRLELYPIANVAVKAPNNYTSDQYNSDDGRGHSGDMLIRDIAYYPTGFSMSPLAR